MRSTVLAYSCMEAALSRLAAQTPPSRCGSPSATLTWGRKWETPEPPTDEREGSEQFFDQEYFGKPLRGGCSAKAQDLAHRLAWREKRLIAYHRISLRRDIGAAGALAQPRFSSGFFQGAQCLSRGGAAQ